MKALVLFSGGLDSTVLAAQLQADGVETRLLSIDYGQRHAKELDKAEKIAHALGLPHRILRLPDLGPLLGGSSLTDDQVELPEGHYAEESMKATVVPNRNMILLALAGGHALSIGFDTIAYAAHAGDHTIYPDCRPEFADAMEKALGLADWQNLNLHRPFVNFSKEELVRKGNELGAPLELTWSCYAGRDKHCGKCGTCVERKEAFALAKVEDPTEYEDD
ncbi:MAG: 7-cyano-7-deazaguanine synthase QueC [Opitutales bacterium]|nr:7-cyano-7-deazaguanine synthase QueC [Opitutales bacterium]